MTRDVWGDANRDFLAGPSTAKVGASLGATDVKETDTAYELHVDVPGLTKDDVKVPLSRICGVQLCECHCSWYFRG
jgi:HSP20 family molecular chaperone IbpA